MFNQILRPLARRALQRGTQNRLSHDHGHHSNFKYPTMDECCHPQGPWQENFDKQQRKYNMQFAVGLGVFLLSVITINQMELIYFNYAPPKPKE